MEATVTKGDYMGDHLSDLNDYPIENVTWFDAQAFAAAKSKNDPIYNYRLPTEFEWEALARGGTKTAYICGDKASMLKEFVWYSKNSANCTHPAKSKQSNNYGIFLGNVKEWTASLYDRNYSSSEGLDPAGPTSGLYRVIRGGGWSSNRHACRSAYRAYASPDRVDGTIGFRLVRTKK